MSNPRVNLLKKSEQRYQGAVSRRFMLISLVVTPILFIAILSGIKIIQYGGIQASLKSNHEIWSALEPRLAVAKEQKKGLRVNRDALSLINGWKESQVFMENILLDIQSTTPANVQLERVSVRSEGRVSKYRSGDELSLGYELAVQGVSQGEHAEDTVINLRKKLLTKTYLSSMFDSVKLVSMRKQQGRNGENMRRFSFEGKSADSEVEP